MSLRDILSPHFHESYKDQSSYIKSLTAGKKMNSFFRCRSDVISQTIFFTHAHTREKHDKIRQKLFVFQHLFQR